MAQNAADAPTVGYAAQSAASSHDAPVALANHPRYRVLQLLGSGGMGSVYKAEHRKMERTVALKVLNPELIRNAAALQRFLQEVKTAAKLLHPNIVTAHDADEAGGVHFLVMEYVEGVSLADLVRKRGRMPVPRACECMRQAAIGLQHAFEKGMVHRDIKPQNLMLSAQGRVKILDFGLARFAMESATAAPAVPGNSSQKTGLTLAGAIMGTPDYMAPEQAADARQADIRADIYSLGCTLYDLLSGQPPFPEGTLIQKVMAHHERLPRPLTDFRADVPPELMEVLAKMMAKDPARRYQTPIDVAKALAPFVKPGAAPGKEAVPREEKPAAADSVRTRSARAALPVASDSMEKELIVIAKEESRKRKPVKPTRPARKRREPWYRKTPVWIAAGAALALLLVVFGTVMLARNRPSPVTAPPAKATLTVEADGADAVVLISQDGKHIGRLDPKQARSLELESGRYHLELEGAPEGISLSRKTATLLPGDAVIVKLQRTQSSADAAGKLAKETKPSAEPQRPTGLGEAAKFVPLFNGENLNGWEKVGKGDWTVDNGVLRAQGDESPGWLATERIYADFELALEYRLGPKGNSGVFVHAWKEGNPSGGQFLEIQLIDDQAYNTVGKDNGTAAIFGVVAPKPTVQSIPNTWHKLSIRAKGRRLQVSFDGRQVIDFNLDDYPYSFQRFPGLKRTTGLIGLQHFGTPVEFRNIQIKELSAGAQLLIESEEASASVVVKRDGKIVAGPTTESTIPLSPGDYELDWSEPQPLLQFSMAKF
ncbi:MAG TPA: family 16 glycoside hydrolase, partial [Gemmataceae bacterium]|nr:family 16 glycoside hydrolase [Gemmataceae bacterium]